MLELTFGAQRACIATLGATLLGYAVSPAGLAATLEARNAGIAACLFGAGASSEIRIWQDPGFAYVHVYTADTLPDAGERRHSVAIEPMTCAPDAFNSGDGLRVLGPGESFRGRWGVALG